MHADRPSFTAAWVATCRGLAGLLPPGQPLCADPWGLRFGGPGARALALVARHSPRTTWFTVRAVRPVVLTLYWVQLRTRLIDERLLDFVSRGGRQVVLLGAGYDARAERLRERLAGVRLFEVDHPATQRRKRRLLRRGGVGASAGEDLRYVSWDFERDPMDALPRRLAALGHDVAAPTFTIWEGVTMYLTEPAASATVSAVHAWSGQGSALVFDYFRRASLARRSLAERWVAHLVTRRAEPFRFGWEPEQLPGWLERHGFALERDESDAAVAQRLLAPEQQRLYLAAHGGWEFHLSAATPRPPR